MVFWLIVLEWVGGEEWKSQDQQEEIKRLCAQVELPSKPQGAGKCLEERGEPARRGSGLEEGCRMEFQQETEYKENMRQLGDIEKFASLDPVCRDRQKEIWKEELEEIERKRTELPPERQKLQKRSQKLQSLRDKQRNHLKNARDCEEVQTLNVEWEDPKAHYETRFRALSEKSGDSRKAAAELGDELQNLQASEKRRGSSASQSNGYCFEPATLEQFPTMGAAQAMQQLACLQAEVSRVFGGQHRPEQGSFGRRMG